jgi:hypothetical protein
MPERMPPSVINGGARKLANDTPESIPSSAIRA